MFAGNCSAMRGKGWKGSEECRCRIGKVLLAPKTPRAVSRLKSLRQFRLYIFLSRSALAPPITFFYASRDQGL